MQKRFSSSLCPEVCAERRAPTADELGFLRDGVGDAAIDSLVSGRGCGNCRETGYRGRVGVFELLMVDDPVRARIQDRSNASEIRDVALTRGMRLLRDDGVVKIRQGLTSVEEVGRVTVRAEM